MKSFLENILSVLFENHKSDLSGACVILPTRRSGLFLKQLLKKEFSSDKMPSVFAIEDFIEENAGLKIPDKLVLISHLYSEYKKLNPDEKFSDFYSWGEIILNDFDEIDKNLVIADRLFKVIREIKDVDAEIGFSAFEIEGFKEFWNKFSNREITGLQTEFVKTWQLLGRLYANFRKALFDLNIGYEGMAYRRFYENVKTKSFELKWNKIYFCGLNKLSLSEKEIIREFINKGKAEYIIDADKYYYDDDIQEAGKYLKDSVISIGAGNPKFIENILSSSEKSIKVIGAPLQAGQAKALGYLIENLSSAKINVSENTAVVLPDENLLMPVLHSIPENVERINVTMGYKFKNTGLYNLIELLRNLHQNAKHTAAGVRFKYKDASRILMNPYIKFIDSADAYTLVSEINTHNVVYISREKLNGKSAKFNELLDIIFFSCETTADILNYMYKVLDFLTEALESSKEDYAKFEREYFYVLYEQLNHLTEVLNTTDEELDTDTFWKLLFEVLRGLKIPFAGEPLRGLQVMGLLETRALDFENVFILSMNEGILPAGDKNTSFIPYNLRKAFKLPTYDEEDCLSAYYFYRLLQKAKNIFLIYNTEVDLFSSGEKSRFLLQIENELVKKNTKLNFESALIRTDIPPFTRRKIQIDKNKELQEKIKSFDRISPSDLTVYITCPLKLYFRKAAKLKETEELEESFGPAAFGDIVHKIIHLLYKPYINKIIDKTAIEAIKEKIENDFDKILLDAFINIPEMIHKKPEMEGINLLYKNVFKKLITNITEQDLYDAPFEIIELENKISGILKINVNGKPVDVNLYGRIDRIDRKNGLIRIIDYKTGSFKLQTAGRKTPEDYFEKVFSTPDYKENLQAYFYGYLYSKNNNVPVSLAIYPLVKINQGLVFIEKNGIPSDTLKLYEENLIRVLSELYTADIPFTQTEDTNRCMFCEFKSICYRE